MKQPYQSTTSSPLQQIQGDPPNLKVSAFRVLGRHTNTMLETFNKTWSFRRSKLDLNQKITITQIILSRTPTILIYCIFLMAPPPPPAT